MSASTTVTPPIARLRARANTAEVGFVGSCRRILVVGIVIRLILAPFTSTPNDVGVWATSVRNAVEGVSLYARPGFSYPPVWGYLLQTGGFVAKLLGVSPQSVATTPPLWGALAVRDWQLSKLITTPLATLLIKVPLICSDVVVAWLIWQIMLSLGTDPRRARRRAKTAVVLWFLSPLVIFESGVHGAFDTLVALTIAAALLARLRQHYFLAGAALSIGVLTKLTPALLVPLFLATCQWPMGNEEKVDRGRAFVLMAAGGVVAFAVGILPLVADGTLHAAYANVFTRSSAASSVGGLSWLGFGSLPQFSSVIEWALQPGNVVIRISVLCDLVPALGAVLMWRRVRRDGAAFVGLSTGVMLLIVVIGPLANPQYLLWILPALVVLAASNRRLLVASWLFAAAGVMFEIAVTSPLAFLTPAYLAFGVPSLHAIVADPLAIATTTFLGVPVDGFIEFAAFVVTMAASLLAGWELRRVLTSGTASLRSTSARTAGPGLRILSVAMLGGPILLGLLPATLEAAPASFSFDVQAHATSPRAIGISWHTKGSPLAGAALTALTTPSPEPVRSLVIYSDPAYPGSGSSDVEVQGVVDHLPVDLAAADVHVRTRVVDARQLAGVLRDRAEASGTVVVDAAGTLPNTVWGVHIDAVTPFVDAGGSLVWGGDEPGYYSVGRSPSMNAYPPSLGTPDDSCGRIRVSDGPPLAKEVTVMGASGVAKLLGRPGLLPSSWGWGCTATARSRVAAALGLSSVALHAGPQVTDLQRIHGANLGYAALGRTSISWIPHGKGGVLLFAGTVDASSFSADTATLLASAGARPDISVASRLPDTSAGTATIPSPPGSCRVEVTLAAIDPNAAFYLDHHTTATVCQPGQGDTGRTKVVKPPPGAVGTPADGR